MPILPFSPLLLHFGHPLDLYVYILLGSFNLSLTFFLIVLNSDVINFSILGNGLTFSTQKGHNLLASLCPIEIFKEVGIKKGLIFKSIKMCIRDSSRSYHTYIKS